MRSPASGKIKSSNTHVEATEEVCSDPGAIPGTSITYPAKQPVIRGCGAVFFVWVFGELLCWKH